MNVHPINRENLRRGPSVNELRANLPDLVKVRPDGPEPKPLAVRRAPQQAIGRPPRRRRVHRSAPIARRSFSIARLSLRLTVVPETPAPLATACADHAPSPSSP